MQEKEELYTKDNIKSIGRNNSKMEEESYTKDQRKNTMEKITFNETIKIAMNIITKIYIKTKKHTLQRKRSRNVFEKLYDNT